VEISLRSGPLKVTPHLSLDFKAFFMSNAPLEGWQDHVVITPVQLAFCSIWPSSTIHPHGMEALLGVFTSGRNGTSREAAYREGNQTTFSVGISR
jgi:hypothetical protein